jgi:hypothetical protein
LTNHLPDPAVPVLALEPDDLDGHTIDELSDYLAHGHTPPNASIDGSAACQMALAALGRLRTATWTLLDDEAALEEPRDDSWVTSIMSSISLDSRAGRDIPLVPPTAERESTITEGAVRGMIRTAGDSLDGLIVGRVHLDGDVTQIGEPITIRIDATSLWGHNIPNAADALRRAVLDDLTRHTALTITGIDVTVHDLHTAKGT